MIDYKLMAALDRMDYSGTLREWLGRIPIDVLYALRDCYNDGNLKPVLYATINRLNEEAGNPPDGFETNTEQLKGARSAAISAAKAAGYRDAKQGIDNFRGWLKASRQDRSPELRDALDRAYGAGIERLNRSATLLGGFLTILSMERDGCVVVDWPLLLTYNPASTVRVRATEKGRARMKELELKAALG
jgi:hypothetical protein